MKSCQGLKKRDNLRALVPPRTGIGAMLPDRRILAGSETRVTLSGTGLKVSMLTSMICLMVAASAARTQVRLSPYLPGQPRASVRLYHAPKLLGAEGG